MKPILIWCLVGVLILGMLCFAVVQTGILAELLQPLLTRSIGAFEVLGQEIIAQMDASYAEDAPTEPPTESPTEAPTEPSTEPPTEAPTEPEATDAPIELETNPLQPINWVVRCNNYLVLRKKPDTSATGMGKLIPGEKVTLLGWEGKFAKVRWNGKEGYILAGYIQPATETYLEDILDTVPVTDTYTHGQLLADIQTLAAAYPQLLTVEILGQSQEGRDIPVLRLGREDASHHVLLHGAIHGREHVTTWLLMALAEHQLRQGLPEDVCFHIIPMVNPDGVTISQTRTLGEVQKTIYQRDKANKYTTQSMGDYAARWKANGLGVDLNRSFPSGWDKLEGHKEASSERYPGTEPFDAVEARLLRDYTLGHSFDATVSMHSTGSIIYYNYGKKQPVNRQSKSLAQAVRELTGYRLEGQSGVDGAGYKDWAIEELEIPSLTLEVGCLDAPIVRRELESIFARCYDLLPVVALWVTGQ